MAAISVLQQDCISFFFETKFDAIVAPRHDVWEITKTYLICKEKKLCPYLFVSALLPDYPRYKPKIIQRMYPLLQHLVLGASSDTFYDFSKPCKHEN